MATTSITSALLNTVNANNALSALFGSSSSFANPAALAETAQAVLAFQDQFPPQQAVALSGLFTQLSALSTAALPLLSRNPQANALLVAANSPVLPENPFEQHTVSSTNSTAVSAAALTGATNTSYSVGVNQLAVAQVNTGTAFTSSSANSGGANLSSGTLNVTVNGVSAQGSYTIGAAVTNEVALTTVANAINSVTNNNDIQSVTLTGATSGSFTLSFGGQTTTIAANASASAVRAALGALTSVGGVANVNVVQGTGGTLNSATSNGASSYTIAFGGTLANEPLGKITASTGSLNSGASISATVVGPTATVSTSSGNSTVVVAAGAAGSANAFSLSDASGTGITNSAANTTTTSAQDAIYTLNGAIYRATSGNTASIDNGNVSLTFSATTSSAATVTVASSTTDLTSAVTNLVSAYNNLQSYLSSNSTFISPQLGQQAEAIITANSAGLSLLGITGNTSLSINSTTLSDASAELIKSIISGPTGMATQLNQLTASLLTSPEGPLAAAPQQQQNTSDAATGLAPLYGQLLLASQGLGSNVSVHA